MKLKELSDYLEHLIEKTEKKSEINFYKTFVKLLESLQQMKLPSEKIIVIEKKLDELDLQSINEKKYRDLKKKFLKFTTYLEEDFNLIQEGHYASLGMTLGMMFGIVIATSLGWDFGMGNETTGGLILGMSLGSIIGYFLDKKAVKDNRVLKVK